jgi:hypothetical protein
LNCSQARIALAAYREYKHHQTDTTALDIHLEQCAACREVLAQQDFVGEQLHSLPALEPAPDAYARLMQTLAIEHTRFMQQSPSTAPSAPNFLKPYLKDPIPSKRTTTTLAAFSTAETGPLPALRTKPRRSASYIGQFAVLGLAATLVMVLMMGAFTSLLLLANHGQPVTSVALEKPSQVAMARYTTMTPYTHVVSAVANREYIYYTAYGDGNTGWMLEQFDTRTKTSTPLLSTESSSSLIALASSNDWLIWLELDTLKPIERTKTLHPGIHGLSRTWRLNAQFIGTQLPSIPDFTVTLPIVSGTFDQNMVPSWVHSPIQGISLTQNTLLAATIDEKGIAHLVHYQLDSAHAITSTAIATAGGGHILTSPTSTKDGTTLSWAEEWLSSDDTIHSNIWLQQTTAALRPLHGYWQPHTIIIKNMFRADEASFHPQIVNDTLFFLSTNTATNTAQATPGLTATAAPTVGPSGTSTSVTSRVDTTIYIPQLDAAIRGTLLALPLDDVSAQPLSLTSDELASAPQAGTRFLFWQSDKGYEMYDAVAKSPVTVGVGTVPDDASFLAVNGDSAVWMVASDNQAQKTNVTSTDSSVTFRLFNWPTKAGP